MRKAIFKSIEVFIYLQLMKEYKSKNRLFAESVFLFLFII